MKRSKLNIMWLTIFGMVGISSQSQNNQERIAHQEMRSSEIVKLFLCGDVMTGRRIDQALPTSVDPVLYESYVKDARDYLRLAERENGKIKEPVTYDYIWGDALDVWKENAADLKLTNLETSITTYNEPWPGKGIHYRMHPENVEVLKAAGIDHCSLANNHTLDWGRPGLIETMRTLQSADIKFSGVGENENQAAKPSVLHTGKGRVLVFSYGSRSSGIPPAWAAGSDLSGVNLLSDLSQEALRAIKEEVRSVKVSGDLVIFSVHWGRNWGYDVSERKQEFAHQLIDEAGIDVIFGHSSHHPMGVEVYKDKLVIYGAGDFLNDYEGISGNEQYRGELTLMYFPEIDPENGQLQTLKMVPMEIKKLRLKRARTKDVKWLEKTLSRESEKMGTRIRRADDNVLWLEW